jgi:hypothetical protein
MNENTKKAESGGFIQTKRGVNSLKSTPLFAKPC